MGDINQVTFLKKFVQNADGPILEIGSKDYGSTSSFRDYFPDNPYVGLDLEEGKGVDVIQDLTQGIGSLEANSFGLIICCSVLEHTDKPWVMADNITRLMRPGGKIYMSVPWVWRYHAYPDDYFRFSFRGVIALFPELHWDTPYYSTTCPGEFIAVTPENLGVDNDMAASGPAINGGQRKYLPYLMVNMIGTKRS